MKPEVCERHEKTVTNGRIVSESPDYTELPHFSLISAVFPLTNLWLLLVMVAREQVGNGAGPQRSNEGASVIGHLGLLPNHHLQQYDTSQLP